MENDFQQDWGYSDPSQMQQGPQGPSDQQQQDPSNNALDILDDLNKLDELDQKFKDLYKDVVNLDNDMQIFSSNIQRLEINNTVSLISRQSESKSIEDEEYTKDLNQLLNSNTDDILKIFNDFNISNNRKKLYNLYNEISEINPIAYRMLKVYVDNILVKDTQTKQFINIKENEQNEKIDNISEAKKKLVINFIKMVLIYFDIQNKLKNNIIPNTLKHGDYYIEVVDTTPVENIIRTKKELLTESIEIIDNNRKTRYQAKFGYLELPNKELQESVTEFKSPKNATFGERLHDMIKSKEIQEADINLLSSILGLEQEENPEKDVTFNFENFQELDFNCLKNVFLRLVSPSNVIKVEKDGIQYGYLIIEELDDQEDTDNEINLYARFMSDDGSKSNQGKNKEITDQIVDKFTDSIIGKLGEYLQSKDYYMGDLPEELQLSLKVILYEKIKKQTKLKFRFLEPDKLINFHTNIDKFAPYGTSIFDPIVLPVKLYTVALMASVISRLSRASVLRKWNIEVGNRRNHAQIVENVKKELKSKNITFDDLSSMKSISQILTDFRDIATVTKNGQKFIDLELMPMQDRALPINDLQDLRNELIAATGIPSVYLNIGDQAEQRETLVNLNLGFANTIAGYQGYVEDGLNHLLNTIFKIILKYNNLDYKTFNLSQYFKLTLNAPLVLQLQNSEAVISTVANIIGILQQTQINVNPIELFKQYAPTMNWDKIQQSGEDQIKEQMKQQMLQTQAPQAGQDGSQQQGIY